MTATEKDLLALEKEFWTGDTEFYRPMSIIPAL